MAQMCALNLNKMYQKYTRSTSTLGFTTVHHQVDGSKIKTYAVHAAPLIVASYYSTRKGCERIFVRDTDYLHTLICSMDSEEEQKDADLLRAFRRDMRDTAVVSTCLFDISLAMQDQSIYLKDVVALIHNSVLRQVEELCNLLGAKTRTENRPLFWNDTPLMLYTNVKKTKLREVWVQENVSTGKKTVFKENLGGCSNEVNICNRLEELTGQKLLLGTSTQYSTFQMEYVGEPATKCNLSEPEICEYLISLMEQIRTLHSHNVVHCDIKDSNIMWDKVAKKATLIDFDYSIDLRAFVDADAEYSFRARGCTPMFAAPEACFDKNRPRLCMKSDVWSAGLVALRLCVTDEAKFNNWCSNLRALNQRTNTSADGAHPINNFVVMFQENLSVNPEFAHLICNWARALLIRQVTARPQANQVDNSLLQQVFLKVKNY